jgi:hypothetical protein
VDRAAAEEWICSHVTPTGAIEVTNDEPWATVMRVPVRDSAVWFKACAPVQAFEPRMTAALYTRWPDRIAEVLAVDAARAWLLLADAGTPLGAFGNPPEAWQRALPLYAELQRGEAAHAVEHLDHGVPDLRTAILPARYEAMLERDDLPLEPDEIERLHRFVPRFAELCTELASRGIPDTVQHDDLHLSNVYSSGDHMLVLDWGDSCVAHPFGSLVVTFEHLDQLHAGDPWFARLRDAYLEPWGKGLLDTFELAFRVATIAHAAAWFRQYDHLPDDRRAPFMEHFPEVLRRAVAYTDESAATYW